jgi:hypothetical protein
MRGVSLLLRLARHDLEERRSDLGCISRAQTETENAIETLDETMASESSIAMTDPAGLAVYGEWAGRTARGRTQLQNQSEELDLSASATRESLRDTAAQVRRLELVIDTARATERRLLLRRANARADERELIRRAELTSA